MSFRFEKKVLFHNSDYLKLKKIISDSKGIQLYPKRIIESLYFENSLHQTFLDSEEGCMPRKKIRIRTYPNEQKKITSLEKKISSVEGRFKLTEKISKYEYKSFLKNGIFDNQYGICYPILWVRYEREYYYLLENRITIDKNIKFIDYASNNQFYDNDTLILEVKSKKMNYKIFENFPQFTEVRISKFSNGMTKVFKGILSKKTNFISNERI